jgi:hypothetical protein
MQNNKNAPPIIHILPMLLTIFLAVFVLEILNIGSIPLHQRTAVEINKEL